MIRTVNKTHLCSHTEKTINLISSNNITVLDKSPGSFYHCSLFDFGNNIFQFQYFYI